jgi:predicted ester cyclase
MLARFDPESGGQPMSVPASVRSVVALVTLLAAGTGPHAQAGQSPEQVARRAIDEVWNRGKFDGPPIMAPSMTLHYRGQANVLTPESSRAVVERWRAAFPDFHFTIEDVIVQGNKVVLRVPFTGTHQGKFWGLDPTGKAISVTETLICRVENGLIVEMWEDFDEYGMRVQLGLIKPAPGA